MVFLGNTVLNDRDGIYIMSYNRFFRGVFSTHNSTINNYRVFNGDSTAIIQNVRELRAQWYGNVFRFFDISTYGYNLINGWNARGKPSVKFHNAFGIQYQASAFLSENI